MQNEMEVREYFAMHAEQLGYRILISRARFPDYILERLEDGQIIRAEAETVSSSFREHGHSDLFCDLIVCWKHNDPTLRIPILELGTVPLESPNPEAVKSGLEDRIVRLERAIEQLPDQAVIFEAAYHVTESLAWTLWHILACYNLDVRINRQMDICGIPDDLRSQLVDELHKQIGFHPDASMMERAVQEGIWLWIKDLKVPIRDALRICEASARIWASPGIDKDIDGYGGK